MFARGLKINRASHTIHSKGLRVRGPSLSSAAKAERLRPITKQDRSSRQEKRTEPWQDSGRRAWLVK